MQETIETIHVQANRTITAITNRHPHFYASSSNAHCRDAATPPGTPFAGVGMAETSRCRPADNRRPSRPADGPCNMMQQKTGVCFIPHAPPTPKTANPAWGR